MAPVDPKDPAAVQQKLRDMWAQLGQGGGFGLDDFTGLGSGMATDGAHLAGNLADNNYAKLAAAAALAATGVGTPASMAIMGGMGAAGGALKDGGNLRDAVTGGATGAAEGYGASKVGDALYAGVGGGAGGAASTAGTVANMAKAGATALTGGGKTGVAPDSTAATVLKLLGLAGTAVGGVNAYQGAASNGAARDAALARNTGISDALEQQGRSIMAGQAPIRSQAEGALSGVLARGAPVAPNVNALADTRNPFRARYGPAVPPPPAVMPAAPAAAVPSSAAPIPGATQVSPAVMAGFLQRRGLPAGS